MGARERWTERERARVWLNRESEKKRKAGGRKSSVRRGVWFFFAERRCFFLFVLTPHVFLNAFFHPSETIEKARYQRVCPFFLFCLPGGEKGESRGEREGRNEEEREKDTVGVEIIFLSLSFFFFSTIGCHQ